MYIYIHMYIYIYIHITMKPLCPPFLFSFSGFVASDALERIMYVCR